MRVNKERSLWKILFCTSLIVLCSACQSSVSSLKEYEAWIGQPEHGLFKTLHMGRYDFKVQYEPAEYVLLKRHKGKWPAQDEYQAELKELQKGSFFTLSIASDQGNLTQGEDGEEYGRKLLYFSFGFQQDLFLEENGKRKSCDLFYFDQMKNQLGNEAKFSLGFENSMENSGDKTLCIESDEMGVGILRLHFSSKDLNNIPELKYGDAI